MSTNKILLGHSRAHLFTYDLRWLLCYNGQVELQQRPFGPQNNKYLVFGTLQESTNLCPEIMGRTNGHLEYSRLSPQII